VSESTDGATHRNVAAPEFIVEKLAAYSDRGASDARASHDIEDVVALIVSRPAIVREIAAAEPAVRSRVAAFATRLLESGIAEEVVAAHLNNAEDVALAVRVTMKRIGEMTGLR
jgi:hypothetical protein